MLKQQGQDEEAENIVLQLIGRLNQTGGLKKNRGMYSKRGRNKG